MRKAFTTVNPLNKSYETLQTKLKLTDIKITLSRLGHQHLVCDYGCRQVKVILYIRYRGFMLATYILLPQQI